MANLSLLVSCWHLDALPRSPNLQLSLLDPFFSPRFNSEEPRTSFREGQGNKPPVVYVHKEPWDVTCLLTPSFPRCPEWAIKIRYMQKYSNIYSAACSTLATHLILNKNSVPAWIQPNIKSKGAKLARKAGLEEVVPCLLKQRAWPAAPWSCAHLLPGKCPCMGTSCSISLQSQDSGFPWADSLLGLSNPVPGLKAHCIHLAGLGTGLNHCQWRISLCFPSTEHLVRKIFTHPF